MCYEHAFQPITYSLKPFLYIDSDPPSLYRVKYKTVCKQSVQQLQGFWTEIRKRLSSVNSERFKGYRSVRTFEITLAIPLMLNINNNSKGNELFAKILTGHDFCSFKAQHICFICLFNRSYFCLKLALIFHR